jgi:hypothetical protein
MMILSWWTCFGSDLLKREGSILVSGVNAAGGEANDQEQLGRKKLPGTVERQEDILDFHFLSRYSRGGRQVITKVAF